MHDTLLIPFSRQPLRLARRAALSLLAASFMGVAGMPASLAASATPTVRAPQVDSPKRVLLVGNSYMYYGDSLHNHVRRMVDAGGITPLDSLQYKSATIGGSALEHHAIDWLTTPGRIGFATLLGLQLWRQPEVLADKFAHVSFRQDSRSASAGAISGYCLASGTPVNGRVFVVRGRLRARDSRFAPRAFVTPPLALARVCARSVVVGDCCSGRD